MTVKPDPVYARAKKKLGEAIDACAHDTPEGVDRLLKLAKQLTEMKEVELKAADGDWGAGLTGDDK